jgi:hypothetical protein
MGMVVLAEASDALGPHTVNTRLAAPTDAPMAFVLHMNGFMYQPP